MINIIDIYVSDRGEIKKDVTILAMKGENDSKALSIQIPATIADKWIYLDFEKPDNTKRETERLEVLKKGATSYVEYTLPSSLLDLNGTLKMEVVAKDADNLVWKSYTTTFTIKDAICATESIAASNPDVLADLQRQIDEIEVGGGSNDYNKLINKPTIPNTTSQLTNDSGYITNEKDPTVPEYVKKITQADINKWNSGGTDKVFDNSISTQTLSSITIEPFYYKVINVEGNSLTLTFKEIGEGYGYRVHQFEIGIGRVVPVLTITNEEIQLPMGFALEKYKRYQCEVINDKLSIKAVFNNYPYKWVFGLWSSPDYTTSYNFKEDLTCTQTISGATTEGTYEVNESDTAITISVTLSDGTFLLFTKNEDGTITSNSVVYTKLT